MKWKARLCASTSRVEGLGGLHLSIQPTLDPGDRYGSLVDAKFEC